MRGDALPNSSSSSHPCFCLISHSYVCIPPLTPHQFIPLGERHCLPSRPRHAGHCGLRRTLQLLGQRRPHQVEDLRAAGPANHGLLLQPQWQHLRIRFQLRLVKGIRWLAGVWSWLKAFGMDFIFFFPIWISLGPWVLQPPEKELHLPQGGSWGAEAAQQEMVREGQPLSVNMEAIVTGRVCSTSSMHLWLKVTPFKAPQGVRRAAMLAVRRRWDAANGSQHRNGATPLVWFLLQYCKHAAFAPVSKNYVRKPKGFLKVTELQAVWRCSVFDYTLKGCVKSVCWYQSSAGLRAFTG